MVSLQRAASIAGGAAVALGAYARGCSPWQSFRRGVVCAVVGIGVEKLLGKKTHALYLAGLAVYAVSCGRKHPSQPSTRRGIPVQRPVADDIASFFAAARAGNVGTMRGMLVQNPDLIAKCRQDGWTALHEAALGDQIGAIELLLEHDPSLISHYTKQNITPLHVAVTQDHVQAGKVLYERDPHLLTTPNNQGLTPLKMAEGLSRAKCAVWLQSIPIDNT